MKKNVLLLCQYFYPEHVSSAILPAQLAEDLAESGDNVSVICGWPQEYHDGKSVPKRETYKGINIYRLRYGNFNNKNKIGRMINFFSFFMSALMKLPKIMKYEVVIVYSNPPILPLIGYWAKKLSKIKLVFVGFDLYPDNAIAINAINPEGAISKMMKYINKRVYSNADRVVAISSDMKHYMLKTHKELDEQRAVVIPNWYTGEIENSEIIKNNEFKKLRETYQLIVLYTGNMGEAQELDTIVESIINMNKSAKYKNVLFVFTGHGSKKDEIEQKLMSAGISNTKFYGFLKGQDYKDILNISDVCLVSLKKGIEGLGVPSKTYGYFAYGKPVISIMSDETELAKNITTYKAGFNVMQNDIEGFLTSVESFLENPKLVFECGENSLKIHNSYYKKSISLEKYRDVIDTLIGTNHIDKGDKEYV
ncbi:MAG: glycosyltransferase family 4 protein [Bacteroidales bacterium]|nr:glycosyltransferase family 4 protein [Bacteroidales bacterium]